MRHYKRVGNKPGKFWVGGLDQIASDGFTGGVLATLHERADKQEYHMYFPLMERLLKATGGVMPEAVAGDRGLSVEAVFRWNTEHGIASVLPFRIPGGKVERHRLRCEHFDEHGVARCPVCGGPGAQIPGVTFTSHGYPRVRFRCADPNTIDCLTKAWSVDPGADKYGWISVIPLSRLTPRYHAMSATSLHFEKNFKERRKRYWLDGADETGKIKRFGLNAHRLRSAAARFLEWFRICLRHGWIKDAMIKLNTRETRLRGGGEDRRLTTLRARRWQGLDLPYGPQAFALGLAPGPDVPGYRKPKKKQDDDDGY